MSNFERLTNAFEGVEIFCISCGKRPEIIDVMNLKYPYLCDGCKRKEVQNLSTMKKHETIH